MTTPQTPQIQQIVITDIDAGDRMRPVSEAGVASLKASITELGVMKDPVQIRRTGRGDTAKLILMAGGHRLEAARQLGWETIPAMVWADVKNDWAALMEIDDNLSGSDLSTLELAVFMAKRDEVYKRLHPETNAGLAGAAARWNATDIVSFASTVSEKRDISARHVRRLVAAGQRLTPRDVRELAQAKNQPSLKDLIALAKIEQDHIRVDIIDRLKHGTSKNVADAVRAMDTKTPLPVDPVDEAFQKLLTDWKRAPKAAKRRFVDAAFAEVFAIASDVQNQRAGGVK